MKSARTTTIAAVAVLFLIAVGSICVQAVIYAYFHARTGAPATFLTPQGDRYHLFSVQLPYWITVAVIVFVGAVFVRRLWLPSRRGAWLVILAAGASLILTTAGSGVIEMLGYQRPFI